MSHHLNAFAYPDSKVSSVVWIGGWQSPAAPILRAPAVQIMWKLIDQDNGSSTGLTFLAADISHPSEAEMR